MLREFRARLTVEHNPAIDSAVAPPAAFDVRHQRGERVLSPGDRGDNLFLAHGGISNPLSALDSSVHFQQYENRHKHAEDIASEIAPLFHALASPPLSACFRRPRFLMERRTAFSAVSALYAGQ